MIRNSYYRTASASCGLRKGEGDQYEDKNDGTARYPLPAQMCIRDNYYIIPDYQDDGDGARIAELFGGLSLLSGGSGLLEPLARHISTQSRKGQAPDIRAAGAAILLAGRDVYKRQILESLLIWKAMRSPMRTFRE